MVRMLATGVFVSLFTACDSPVSIDAAGGSASSTGGMSSNSSGATGGVTSASSGGSTAIDLNTYCDGLFAGPLIASCHLQIAITTATSCDIPLQQSPPDISLIQVAFNCQMLAYVDPDAGVSGFYIDYNQSPAHLELIGPSCTYVLANGAQSVAKSVAIIEGRCAD